MLFNFYPLFKLDRLSGFISLFIGLFSLLTIIYSFKFMQGRKRILQYYFSIILTAVFSVGAVLANHLILLLVFWGFLGLTLYLLINIDIEETANLTGKKTFIIVGGSDCLLLLGIAIIYYLTGTFQMDKIKISLTTDYRLLNTLAYLCLAVASFAKAGAMPVHSWIPDCAKDALVPVVAYLPASLDKLLGIYLLTRISLDLFVMSKTMNLFLMLIGAFTILAAVMMALVQHNAKRLLGYHAVSQVGYMVLGIGTGSSLGIAGGLFHMLNNAIYKSCLFLTSGNVEYKIKTTDLDKLGGLSKAVPITYISCLVASLSISGVPPFNGFFSKWMIYQGLIQTVGSTQYIAYKVIVFLCLVAAMFGSALTLASFMKLLHSVFLGQVSTANHELSNKTEEVSFLMWFPCLVLAGICVIFGVFARQVPLKYFILPSLPKFLSTSNFLGFWSAGLATFLIILGLILGILIFSLFKISFRRDSLFLGSETKGVLETKVSGTEFYNTIKELGFLRIIYTKAEKGFFDIYEQGKTLIFGIGRFFQFLHNGILPTYLVWCLLGMLVFFVLVF
ncbi:MAG: hypothetical protein NC826_03070 [Candidatus Omnitrophica bacterium]|nr:hypothetical protein [Candidatus Omnitrophota bacterium]